MDNGCKGLREVERNPSQSNFIFEEKINETDEKDTVVCFCNSIFFLLLKSPRK
jgi:hypothetical protein